MVVYFLLDKWMSLGTHWSERWDRIWGAIAHRVDSLWCRLFRVAGVFSLIAVVVLLVVRSSLLDRVMIGGWLLPLALSFLVVAGSRRSEAPGVLGRTVAPSLVAIVALFSAYAVAKGGSVTKDLGPVFTGVVNLIVALTVGGVWVVLLTEAVVLFARKVNERVRRDAALGQAGKS